MVNSGLVQLNGRLIADIDMLNVDFMPIGLFGDDSPLKLNYYGTLDGGKHIISNLSISTNEWYEACLMSRAYNATVKDLGIVNATIETNNMSGRAGVIAGFNRNSNFIMNLCVIYICVNYVITAIIIAISFGILIH